MQDEHHGLAGGPARARFHDFLNQTTEIDTRQLVVGVRIGDVVPVGLRRRLGPRARETGGREHAARAGRALAPDVEIDRAFDTGLELGHLELDFGADDQGSLGDRHAAETQPDDLLAGAAYQLQHGASRVQGTGGEVFFDVVYNCRNLHLERGFCRLQDFAHVDADPIQSHFPHSVLVGVVCRVRQPHRHALDGTGIAQVFDGDSRRIDIGHGVEHGSAAVVKAHQTDVEIVDRVEDLMQRLLHAVQPGDARTVFVRHAAGGVQHEQDVGLHVARDSASGEIDVRVVGVDGDWQTGDSTGHCRECKAQRANAFHTPLPARPT